MVGCFGLNGPLRQYFSLYRAVVVKYAIQKNMTSRVQHGKAHANANMTWFQGSFTYAKCKYFQQFNKKLSLGLRTVSYYEEDSSTPYLRLQ